METLKQIVYREEDGVIMIISNNENDQVIPRFLNELSQEDKSPLESLINYCLTKVEGLRYVVFLSEFNRMDVQPTDGEVVCLTLDELDNNDRGIIDLALSKCVELLNK